MIVLIVIDNMISQGLAEQYRTLGVFYVLIALTLVSSDAATSLPWLYNITQTNLEQPN